MNGDLYPYFLSFAASAGLLLTATGIVLAYRSLREGGPVATSPIPEGTHRTRADAVAEDRC